MNAIEIPWLSAIIFLPLVAALAIPIIPDKEGKTVRWYGLGVALLDFAFMIFALWQSYDFQSSALQMTESYPWIPQLGLNWSLGIDGLSMPLILLTGFINTLAVFAAWKVTTKPRLFYALMLIMYSAQLGVFLSQDLLMFFLMWEVELVPVYLLIAIWGGANRRYAATKFIIYTAAASIFILVAGFAMAFYGDNFTFNMTELGMKEYPKALELALYAGFLIAYGVKLPIFPLHTWLPDAHGEASAPGSMILAGVLLKMGGYALIRFNVEMLTDAHVAFAPVLAILGVVNIVYGACCAFAQTNLKRRLAYSSIAHMGFVLIGIASYTEIGISGAVLQMVSHGLIAASLFFLSGVTYERTHTLVMDKMGGIREVNPLFAFLFFALVMGSVALPLTSGFVGEFLLLLGFYQVSPWLTAMAGLTVVLGAVYMLRAFQVMMLGSASESMRQFAPLTSHEKTMLGICVALVIALGIYPDPILSLANPTVESLLQGLNR
jgi:NAD(P)H-quinone oxidoreductase subunit 4